MNIFSCNWTLYALTSRKLYVNKQLSNLLVVHYHFLAIYTYRTQTPALILNSCFNLTVTSTSLIMYTMSLALILKLLLSFLNTVCKQCSFTVSTRTAFVRGNFCRCRESVCDNTAMFKNLIKGTLRICFLRFVQKAKVIFLIAQNDFSL